MTNKKEFIDWCFTNLNGTEDKYELGLLIWDYLTLENTKLARKLARLDKLLQEYKLADVRPTPTKKRHK